VKPEDQYHAGIVVDDVEATLASLTDELGYTWGEVMTAPAQVRLPSGVVTLEVQCVYSVNEPHLEIVRSIPGTIWAPAETQLHHVGYWSDDVAADTAELVGRGYTEEAAGLLPDGGIFWSYVRSPLGLRVELVDRAMEPVVRQMWGG
jgi:hypothetical protein